MEQAGYYDHDYYETGTKSNYRAYDEESSPNDIYVQVIREMMRYYNLSGPVLDVGCAHGFLVRALRRSGIEAFGVDWSDYATRSAPADVRRYITRASAGALPFRDSEFALALSFDVLEHLDRKSARRMLAECGRVSRWQLHQVNTGRKPEWLYDSDPSHCTKLSLWRWRELAGGLGLGRTLLCEPDREGLPFLREPAAVS